MMTQFNYVMLSYKYAESIYSVNNADSVYIHVCSREVTPYVDINIHRRFLAFGGIKRGGHNGVKNNSAGKTVKIIDTFH